MTTVTISANVYTVYTDVATADRYWGAMFNDAATSWVASDTTKKAQALVGASRLLDRQSWIGTPSSPPAVDVTLAWPRVGITDRNGTAYDSVTIPPGIIAACCEIAGSMILDPSIFTSDTSGANVSSVSAGPVSVSFFSTTLGISGRFQTHIKELLGEFLNSGIGGDNGGFIVSGNTGESVFSTSFGLNGR